MIRLIIDAFLYAAGYASFLGLYYSRFADDATRPTWHLIAIILSGVLLACIFIYDLIENRNESHKKFRSEKSINKYMCNWVSHRGRTVILSRDLSWGGNPTAKNALLMKAKASELKIYLHHSTDLSKELEKAGAEIIYYGHKGFEPKSRFTIIGYGKDGARIAVGTEKKKRHIVYEYDTGEHPITALSDDLTRLLS